MKKKVKESIEDGWEDVNMNNNEDDFVLVKSKVVRQVDSEDSMRMGSYDIRTLEAKVMNIGECLYDKATFEDLQQFEVPGQSSSRERAWKTIVTIEDGTAVRLGLGYLIKKGVPNAKRRDVWLALAGVKHFLKKDVHLKGSYCSRLVEVFGERVPLSIQKPPLFGFKESFESHFLTAQGLEACKRILCVFAMENPGIVYSPSIVDLVCLFLHYVTEEEAYYMLNYVLKNTENRNYHIPTSKKDCQKVIFTFANFLEHKSKHLYHHIQSLNFDTEFFEKWLIRFFVGEMPYSKVIRILDAFLLEGYSILFRVGLALLLENQNSLMKCTDGKNFTNMLQQITTQLIDDNTLMKTALGLSLKEVDLPEMFVTFLDHVKEPSIPIYYRPKIDVPPKIFPEELFEHIYAWLPDKIRIKDPVLLHTPEVDGYSFKKFINRIAKYEFVLLVLKSQHGQVFGAFTDTFWNPGDAITGGIDCFVFTLHPTIAKYAYVPGAKPYFLLVKPDSFTVGLGSNSGVALYVDHDWRATSGKCEVFDNTPLNHPDPEDFTIINWELYTFK